MNKYGFIGMGNMGYAIMKGMLKICDKADLLIADKDPKRVRAIYDETGVMFAESNAECASKVKYVILAVKPQNLEEALKNIRDIVKPNHIIISIVAGTTVEMLQRKLGYDIRAVVSMPNTPALVGEGMTGVYYDKYIFLPEEIEEIEQFFNSFGKMKFVEEKLMNVVTCASGSSPAYVFMLAESLADAVVKHGMPRAMAYELVAQTIIGAGRLLAETNMHPALLKDMVCSPNGTTIEAVAKLEENGFRNAIIKATDACYDKTTKL